MYVYATVFSELFTFSGSEHLFVRFKRECEIVITIVRQKIIPRKWIKNPNTNFTRFSAITENAAQIYNRYIIMYRILSSGNIFVRGYYESVKFIEWLRNDRDKVRHITKSRSLSFKNLKWTAVT